MRSVNKTVYVQPSYSQTRIPVRPIPQESQQQPILSQSRERGDGERQKTEQLVKRYISPNAIKSINEHLYQIVSMDPRSAQSNLRKSAKSVYDIIDNELLLNIKHLSNMKLLMYDTILMFVQQYSQHERDKFEWRQRQKYLLNSVKNAVSMKQQEVALQTFSPVLFTNGNNKQLQYLKQTLPFVPKDNRGKIQKSVRRNLMEEELNNKIESTKQSLENILKKIQHYNNYRLTGEDIIRLKRSVANVSELQPALFINVENQSPIKGQKGMSSLQNSRPLSREGRSRQQSSSKIRQQQKSRTYQGSLNLPQTANTSSLQPSRIAQQLSSDNQQQANRLLIQQLQQIIQKKQNRMKELTKELSKNLADKLELEKTIESFQIQIGEIEGERRNFQLVIDKLQEENLNYQLEIKQLREGQILRKQVGKLSGEYKQQAEQLSQYQMFKQFQTKQRVFKFEIRKQLDLTVQRTPIHTTQNLQIQSAQKHHNSLSGVIPINDISEITPKRLSKRLLLPSEIQESYIYQSQVITKRRNVAVTQVRSKEKRKSKDPSLSKYKIISGSRTQMKSKNQLDGSSLVQVRDNERQDYQKVLFLQALTIEQILQDI